MEITETKNYSNGKYNVHWSNNMPNEHGEIKQKINIITMDL